MNAHNDRPLGNSIQPRVDRPEILWEVTRSLCPECKRLIDAQVLLRAGKVVMRKRCPEHGWFEALVFGDAALYTEIGRFNKPGTIPLQFATEVKDGCPLDCGLCPEHQQHTCLAIIEVNAACNLDCPLCFANSGTHLAHSGWQLTYDQVNFMLDQFVAAEGNPEVLQLSGGEPTLHPQILDFVALAQAKGIGHVMINTNGIRISRDDAFVAELGRLKPNIYLQFDGFDPETLLRLRGRADLLKDKIRALDRLAEADVRVVLVAAVERGVNEHEVGKIVEFGLRHPAVYGVTLQPAFHAQRHIPADPMQRLTIPDLLDALAAQTGGLLTRQDFVPVPCCMPTCHFVTYALLDGDEVLPLPRVLDVELYLDYLKNRTLPGLNDDILHALERLWSSSAPVGSERAARDVQRTLDGVSNGADRAHSAGATDATTTAASILSPSRTTERCSACQANQPLSSHDLHDLARHVFMVNVRDFLDPWTFNVKSVMKCCIEFIVPDGRMIPFCAYNTVGFREQVTAELMAANAKPS